MNYPAGTATYDQVIVPTIGRQLPSQIPSDLTRVTLCLIAALFVLIAKPAFIRVEPFVVVWTTAGTLLALASCEMSAVRKRGGNPWTSASSLACSYYFFRYGFGVLVIYYWDIFPWEAVPAYKIRFYTLGARQNLESSCQLILLGGLGLFMAMGLNTDRLAQALPNIKWPIDDHRLRAGLFFYTPVALVVLLYLQSRLPLTVQFAVSTLGTIIYPAIAVISYFVFSPGADGQRSKWALSIAFLCGTSLVAGLMSGQISEVLLPLSMVVVGYMLARRSLPWKVMLIVGPALVFVVFPYLTLYKAAGQKILSRSIEDRMAVVKEQQTLTGYQLASEITIYRFVGRMALAEFPAIYSRYYPDVYPYANGETFKQEVSFVVPRFLWPNKPEISVELNRYAAAVGIVREDDGTSAVFDAVSEYYLNFGPLGVLFLCVLHGVYLTTLYSWLTNNLSYVVGGSIFFSLFLINLDFFGVGQIVMSHIKILPVWIVLFYFLSRRSSSPSASGSVAYVTALNQRAL
jgi:hypothetical protein